MSSTEPEQTIPSSGYPEMKTFKYCDKGTINISTTPTGFSTMALHIKGSPYFGIGGVYSMTAIELPECELYYNDKTDLLLEEDATNEDNRDRRIFKLNFYKDEDTNQYRFDFVPLEKSGNDAEDPWKNFTDIHECQPGAMQMEMVQRFYALLGESRNEPTIVAVCDILENKIPLENAMGIFQFRRVE